MNLNKNQKKFFDKAVSHFGDDSNNVRLKDINEFSKRFDLIVPTSALKKYCQEEGQTRGYYNLTLVGIEPKHVEKPDYMKQFKGSSDIIIDSSVFTK